MHLENSHFRLLNPEFGFENQLKRHAIFNETALFNISKPIRPSKKRKNL